MELDRKMNTNSVKMRCMFHFYGHGYDVPHLVLVSDNRVTLIFVTNEHEAFKIAQITITPILLMVLIFLFGRNRKSAIKYRTDGHMA